MTFKGSFEDLLDRIIANPDQIKDLEIREKLIHDAIEMKEFIEKLRE